MSILITGATGFVGNALCNALIQRDYIIHPITRSTFGEITPITDWSKALSDNIGTVIHLAARVHLMQDTASDQLAAYRAVNTDSTLNLAQQAAAAGVRRFIFLSSIKVNGEARITPYSEQDTPNPTDPYAISKWEAEQGLREITARTNMEVVVLRPPLIYGTGVSANFLRLIHWVETGIPLPFASIYNQRSLLYLGNLVDAIRTCIYHPAAANQTFLVADNESLSSADLIKKIAYHLKRPCRLFPIPSTILLSLLSLIGRKQEAERLLGSLQIDNSHICKTLGWKPPFSTDQGLAQTLNAYQSNYSA